MGADNERNVSRKREAGAGHGEPGVVMESSETETGMDLQDTPAEKRLPCSSYEPGVETETGMNLQDTTGFDGHGRSPL